MSLKNLIYAGLTALTIAGCASTQLKPTSDPNIDALMDKEGHVLGYFVDDLEVPDDRISDFHGNDLGTLRGYVDSLDTPAVITIVNYASADADAHFVKEVCKDYSGVELIALHRGPLDRAKENYWPEEHGRFTNFVISEVYSRHTDYLDPEERFMMGFVTWIVDKDRITGEPGIVYSTQFLSSDSRRDEFENKLRNVLGE